MDRPTTAASNQRIPSNLPKFRGTGRDSHTDPQEFLDMFKRICIAYDIPTTRMPRILPLCLDTVDSKWLDRWLENHNIQDRSWKKLSTDFLHHFQHPNSLVHLQNQIKQLKMGEEGV